MTEDDSHILKELRQSGIYCLPNYYSTEQCKHLIVQIDELLETTGVIIWEGYKQADRRIFGINHLNQDVDNYYRDPKITKISQAYEKCDSVAGFTMSGKLEFVVGNRGSGEGWHRDRCDFRQTKSLLYLTDVEIDCGPFEYIVNSHKLPWIIYDFFKYGIDPLNSRIEEEKVNLIIQKQPERLKVITAKRGSLLLVDTRGIHRGRPIQPKQKRYALTNYYWFNMEIPEHIKKFVNQKF